MKKEVFIFFLTPLSVLCRCIPAPDLRQEILEDYFGYEEYNLGFVPPELIEMERQGKKLF